jgi:hypothetical protein
MRSGCASASIATRLAEQGYTGVLSRPYEATLVRNMLRG